MNDSHEQPSNYGGGQRSPFGNLSAHSAFLGVLLILILATWIRWPAWDPPALYLDDLWQGLLSRMPLSTQWIFRSSSPIGFTLLMGIVMSLVPDPEVGAQLLPFLSGLAVIPLLSWVARRSAGQPMAGVIAAAVLAASPVLAAYSMRAKQFSFDALMVAIFIVLMERACRDAKQFPILLWTALICLPFSFSAAVISTLFINVFVFLQLLQQSTWREYKVLIIGWVVYHLVLGLFWMFVLRGQHTPMLEAFWRGYFPQSLNGLLNGYRTLLAGVLPGAMRLQQLAGDGWATVWVITCILLMMMGLISLLRQPNYRSLGLALLLVYPVIGTMTLLHLYPLGGMRTDIFTYPVTAFLLSLGITHLAQPLFRLHHGSLIGIGVGLELGVVCIIPGLLGFGITYPYNPHGRHFVEQIEQQLKANDVLIVQPHNTFLLAYYTTWSVQLQPCSFYATSFNPVVNKVGVHVLSGYEGYEKNATLLDPEMSAVLEQYCPRVLLFGEQNMVADHLRRRLKDAGYSGSPLSIDETGQLILEEYRLRTTKENPKHKVPLAN